VTLQPFVKLPFVDKDIFRNFLFVSPIATQCYIAEDRHWHMVAEVLHQRDVLHVILNQRRSDPNFVLRNLKVESVMNSTDRESLEAFPLKVAGDVNKGEDSQV